MDKCTHAVAIQGLFLPGPEIQGDDHDLAINFLASGGVTIVGLEASEGRNRLNVAAACALLTRVLHQLSQFLRGFASCFDGPLCPGG